MLSFCKSTSVRNGWKNSEILKDLQNFYIFPFTFPLLYIKIEAWQAQIPI